MQLPKNNIGIGPWNGIIMRNFWQHTLKESIHFQPLKQLSIFRTRYIEWKNFFMHNNRFKKKPINFHNFIFANKITINFLLRWRLCSFHTSDTGCFISNQRLVAKLRLYKPIIMCHMCNITNHLLISPYVEREQTILPK